MMEVARGTAPIICAHLLRSVDERLITLLSSLRAEEWDFQTVARSWTVRDVAAHLLDTSLRKLSMVRDSSDERRAPVQSPRDLVALVNRLNHEGVAVFGRLSPRVLIDLLRRACDESADFHESLDPFAPAAFAVSWAGETSSLNWFDTARELTERWHHQEQIRFATNRPGIMVPSLYHPVLDCFMRGLPHLFRDTAAPPGTVLLVEISGECGGKWFLSRGSTTWTFIHEPLVDLAARVQIPQELAWRVFTNGIDRSSIAANVLIDGDQDLGERILSLRAIVA